MTDIDFDELDRAVNSLIGPNTPKKDTAEPSSINPTAAVVAPAPAITAPVPMTTPLAERRSSGRFMDVVHPSSDMRSNSSAPSRPARREGVSINPLPASQASKSDEPRPVTNRSDPIEATQPVNPAETALVPEDELTKDTNASLESPFLSNAKVDKRPLGAFSSEVHVAEPAAVVEPTLEKVETEPTINLEPKDDSQTTITDSDMLMPAELQPGLLSIEASEYSPSIKTDIATPEVIEPTGPVSITQQYTPQPNTGDKPVAGIFDTAAYKKPQGHAGKKKSGWLVIVWILLLIIVGAGIGAAVYFFILPHL